MPKKKQPNPIHVAAALKSGSGRHPDKKKQASKDACRGKVKEDD